MKLLRFFTFITCAFLCSNKCAAQLLSDDSVLIKPAKAYLPGDTLSAYVLITGIHISGNRKTKGYIINREIPIKIGDSILRTALKAQLQQARTQVYNTNLFADVNIVANLISYNVATIDLKVKERWYIYPSPQFQLTDRSFNEWIKRYNADLSRVTYGAKYTQYNLSGRRDVVRLSALTGYSRNLSFSYTQPYSNKKLTEGFGIGASYTQSREISYEVDSSNKFKQFKNGDFVSNFFSASVAYSIRKGYFRSHTFGVSLQTISLKDENFIAANANNYFHKNKGTATFPDFSYNYRYANVNNINYPLTGKLFGTGIIKRGLGFTGGVNLLLFQGSYNSYNHYGGNWYGSLAGAAVVRLPFDQPFINRRAIGFGSLQVRGLDNYVIDGVAAATAQYTLKRKMLAFDVKFPIKNKFISKIPFTIFAKTFADAGYAFNKKQYYSKLGNKFLGSTGVGIDVITVYDIVIGAEYGVNQLGEKGLFLRIASVL